MIILEQKKMFDKNRTAVALSYQAGDDAPKVVASGKGYVADTILERAAEEKIPIHKDEVLAENLAKLNLGEGIPPELYEIVAEILVFVDDMDHIREKIMK
ncbi:EscU/YscU/HrcU family type III secretion system export apparatus switch protein [Anaeromicropila populeti]